MEERVLEYYNNLDWESMSLMERSIKVAEKKIALGENRDTVLQTYRDNIQSLMDLGVTDFEGYSVGDIREYDDIMQDILVNVETDTPDQLTAPLDFFGVQFDESNDEAVSSEESNTSEPEPTSIVINRRGSHTPLLQDENTTPNQGDTTIIEWDEEEADSEAGSGSDSEEVHTNIHLGNSLFNEPLLETGDEVEGQILGKDIEDEDSAYIRDNVKMMSYFSVFPVNDTRGLGQDSRGNIPLDYAVTVLKTYEEPNEDGELEDMMVAPTMEQAIQYLGLEGFQYNKSKNIFSKEMENGTRGYARILMDVDLRGLFG